MGHFGRYFIFACILNCSTLIKLEFSVWLSAMPRETESIKKIKLDASKQGNAPKLGLAAGLPWSGGDLRDVVIKKSPGLLLWRFYFQIFLRVKMSE